MGLDASADEDAILARLRSHLWSGRIHDEVPDEEKLDLDPVTGLVLPYGILTFGTLFPLSRDRSIVGEDKQPHTLPFVLEMWGATKNDSRAGAYGAIRCLTGFRPSENASEIVLTGGGGGFKNFDQGRPIRFMRPVSGSCVVNMATSDEEDPLS